MHFFNRLSRQTVCIKYQPEAPLFGHVTTNECSATLDIPNKVFT